jgi:DtxR family Mn-dependent transcriptional regulator
MDTTEMYLKAIYELLEEGLPPLRAGVAQRLGHTWPTVAQTVDRMERAGLVTLCHDGHLDLTPAGSARATRVMRRHRLAERLLVDVIGLDWSLAHREACRWEHAISDRVEQRLATLLDCPQFDPYGNPIPGLSELGGASAPRFLDGVMPLTAVGRGWVAIVRIGEPLQTDVSLMTTLWGAGLFPGAAAHARPGASLVTMHASGADVVVDLPDEIARHLYVADRTAGATDV